MQYNRRAFHRGAFLLGVGGSINFPREVFGQTVLRARVIGGGRYQESIGAPANYVVSQVDVFDSGQLAIRNIPTSFFPHGFAVDPKNQRRVIAFEKIGVGACEFSLEQQRVLKVIAPLPDRQFYGHGVFSRDGLRLFATQVKLSTGEGVLAEFDGRTLEHRADFPTFGSHPHDVALGSKGQTLIITNGGDEREGKRRPNLAYVDMNSRTLIAQFDVPGEAFNAGHVQLTPKDTAVLISAPRRGLGNESLGAVHSNTHRVKPGELKRGVATDAVNNSLFGEALSTVLIPEQDLFAVTHPTPGLLSFWRLSSLEHIKNVEFVRPRGVALTDDRRELLVSHGNNATLARIDLKTLTLASQQPNQQTLISGSHLLNWRS